ncbi:sulfite exporter TauE/SafE family protein 4-like isoform X2 [Nymphaea colorata]|uniref:sulfite exporter TauE/SafE family protein 4-like isoform X2 n=1 Tax=Nymphaea colorata TaxID=210225 RepID=UPI00129DDEDA|nr:sulfite exporter TauE/SafE family protein 4-like isoform X2 [Nymphaea colorata]
MGTKYFLVYLLSGSMVVISYAFFSTITTAKKTSGVLGVNEFLKSTENQQIDGFSSTHSETARVWPKLQFSWRVVVVTVIGFLGSALGTVGGVSGGGIFVPMFNLILGFDAKSAAALSKCMIMGASASSVWYNLTVPHPCRDVPILDYDLALLFQPMLMLGITIGVALSVVFPYWLITVLIIILFTGTSSRAFCKAIQMWNQETIMKAEANLREPLTKPETVQIGDESQQLVVPHVKNDLEIICFNIRLKGLLVLMVVWISFLLIQITKNNLRECSPLYWAFYILQFPLALSVFIYEAAKLWKEDRQRRKCGNEEPVCEASIEWTPFQLIFCAFCATLGGTVGGLLGSGAGFIMGPLLLELGVIPQVASATAAFAMMFSSSLSVMELYFLKRFPIPYALYLTGVSIIAGFFGQYFVWKLVAALGRASIIIFILSSVIFASALTMGIVGIDKSIVMIQNHEYMGFLSFCSSS